MTTVWWSYSTKEILLSQKYRRTKLTLSQKKATFYRIHNDNRGKHFHIKNATPQNIFFWIMFLRYMLFCFQKETSTQHKRVLSWRKRKLSKHDNFIFDTTFLVRKLKLFYIPFQMDKCSRPMCFFTKQKVSSNCGKQLCYFHLFGRHVTHKTLYQI